MMHDELGKLDEVHVMIVFIIEFCLDVAEVM